MSKTLGFKNTKRILVLSVFMLMLMVFVTSIGAAEQPDVNSYIIVMDMKPIIAYEGGVEGIAATKPEAGETVNPDSADAVAYGAVLEESHTESLEAAGADARQQVNSYTVALNGYSALLTEAQVEEIKNQEEVNLVMVDELRQPTTDSSPAFLGLTGRRGAWRSGYDGEGVVVGVIDTGIWPEHPSFADDGTFPVPPIVLEDTVVSTACNFGNSAHNAADVPFTCNNKLIGARQMLATYRAVIGADAHEYDSARDDGGHGTHTASTAAGNAGVPASILGIDRGNISGIAPRAHVVAYKGLGTLGGFSSDLAAAIDQAVADGVDVINYSIGGGAGTPGVDDIAFLFAADAGVFVATSAGNSGPGSSTIGGPAHMPWMTTVGASTQERYFEGQVVIGGEDDDDDDRWGRWGYWGHWDNDDDECGDNDDRRHGKWWHDNDDDDVTCISGVSITEGLSETLLVDAADAGDELCQAGSLDPSIVEGKIVLCKRGANARIAKGFEVYQAGGVGMILYNADDGQSQVSDTHWIPTVHINNTQGLVVKDYIANTPDASAKLIGGEKTRVDAPMMAGFSSRGPNPVSPDFIKPDITAPGVQILAGYTPTPEAGEVSGEMFTAIAGTSMSSPHIAGVFALIKQAHPDWSAAMAKSAIMTTAYQDVLKETGDAPADPFDMGAGHVDPGNPNRKGSAFQPGLVYDAGLFEYAAYTCGADFGIFGAGSCDFLAGLGIPSEAYNLNVPSIGIADAPGSQTVVRTVTSVATDKYSRYYRARIDAPEGYEVSVVPSRFWIAPGESVTFEVTVTNVSAPIDEWAFGSLTWRGSRYNVYSPIAVKSALFSAPAAVVANGESGADSFDVNFGYTGAYAAAAHGLEAATVTEANVVQDPDQTFDPNDGYSTRHDFNLSGEAFFRVALPPDSVNDANIDLDMFVYDPNGVQVASSTSGGTDELVDITLPEDGTWSVYIHGWQTVGASADYTMYSWAVSATPGGNLSIDAAPASATVGASGAVDLSWTGATAGEWHLGAVSHTGDSGLMGLTLVDVDNR